MENGNKQNCKTKCCNVDAGESIKKKYNDISFFYFSIDWCILGILIYFYFPLSHQNFEQNSCKSIHIKMLALHNYTLVAIIGSAYEGVGLKDLEKLGFGRHLIMLSSVCY